MIIRSQDKQQQDISELSRDVEHANPGLTEIFNREKEQNRLKAVQLIGETGAQVSDIVRTTDRLNGLKAAQQAHPELSGHTAELENTAEYKAAIRNGTGSATQKAITAATAAIQGLAGGNTGAALSGAAGPYLAEVVKKLTTDEEGHVNKTANLMGHAVVNAVLALAADKDALSGAAGGATGEAAGLIAGQVYGRQPEALTEQEKQAVSALATLAAGLAGGLAGNSSADVLAAAQAGKTTVENNHLSLPGGLMSYGQAVASWNQYAEEKGLTAEQKQAGLHKLATGDLPEGANITKVIVEGYKDGVLMAGAWYLGPAASVGKVIGGATIAEIANGTYQWFDLSQPGNENKSWDYKGSFSAGLTGALAPGRGVWANLGIAQGGVLFTDGFDKGALTGAGAGWVFGTTVGFVAPPLFNPVLGPGSAPVGDIIGAVGGEFIGNTIKDEINEKKK
ncbi:VENN motif pre-toxin domain-containing protein [Enterobacteriaceae bacterium LUAb1]